ncbi:MULTISPECIES: aspartate aminotransferase family protein [Rahnella]|jgi:4-aminobutyrate aminotransferase and related aminotransferases|uniref:Aminotransferase class-III n=1 Tax=Rahnella sp. (strain Y9602) TaxID=2703885 RepID=A0A0H3FG82_RAHSY|nr:MULTISPECIES: aminotransferase class III-fold pyridoxal phosphate-dependent enzyme [Rahnella]MDP9705302.1 4-aminobutyrate aminotransferase-like enzyme [Rahnella aquatilis]ADW76322.1 aminotransferase class-III [Rahnella aceris]MCM2446566.1 aminotransferase class III-fold pyridoxal phosphate-dependent enzyme [Rahnella sp. CG8]NIA89657.1 aminotransferase class III-fold pyridoxal phosphate-dependent enzyme [Rahnella aceris]RKT75315.1 4-aminobutyrate aminotransferase-like enzyme [Rahnella aquati
MLTPKQVLEGRQQFLGGGYRLFYQEPLHVVRGEGVWLYDSEGRRYLDAYNNVASVGHCHPAVVEAITTQAAQLNTHTRYLNDAIVEFAEDFLTEFPPELRNLTMTCTGSEANDLALRVARQITGGQGVIVTSWAYHGVTSALAELSPSLGDGFEQGKNVWLTDAPDTFRHPGVFSAGVERALEEMKHAGVKPAALLVDTIFSSDGVFSPDPLDMQRAVGLVRAAGGLFIADEVQPGFGRTGSQRWGFARYGVTPDLVSLGKPMGNGHPVAGLVGRPELFAEFGRRQRYFNTFGGNPVSCRAAHAVLQILRREELQQNAQMTGAILREGLQKLAQRYPVIGDVRGDGLFIGVELVSDQRNTPAPELAAFIVNEMRQKQVLISATGPAANVLKIRPPLVFQPEHATLLLQTLASVLAEMPG